MLNTPIQPVQQVNTQTGAVQQQTINSQTQTNPNKTYYEEQSMAISFDIAGEYSAINRMHNIIASLTNELKLTEDPERKKLLEARISTLNTMILQREARINQMEMCKVQIDRQSVA